MNSNRQMQRGFTLVEVIVVMVITGILGGMVAIFIKAPVQGYVDSARRAEMTDIADTALRRLARDIRTAVPNSVRVAVCGGVPCVEFLPTRDGGRYRAEQDCTGACTGDVLNFGATDGSFDIIGAQINFVAGDHIVIGSTQSDGNPPYDTAGTGILRAHDNTKTGLQATVDFTNIALPIWAEVQGQRFDVVDGSQQAVTYACIGTLVTLNANSDGQAQLVRYWNYGFHSTQQAPAGIAANTAPVTSHEHAILADRVGNCEIVYDAVSQRMGLVIIRLEITRGGESVSLYHTIHVNNVP